VILYSIDQLHAQAARLLQVFSGNKVKLSESMRPLSKSWAICRTIAVIAHNLNLAMVRAWRDLFFATGSDTGVRRLAMDRFRLYPKGASPGRGHVVVWANPAPLNPVVIPRATRILTRRGVSLRTMEPVTIPAGSTAKFAVRVETVTAGDGQSADWGDVLGFESAIQPGIFVSNAQDYAADGASRIAGGADAESEDDFRSRMLRVWGSLAKGTFEAIELGAVSVPGVAQATAVKLGRGHVRVYVCDRRGMSSTALEDDVSKALKGWAAAGEAVTVVGGRPVYLTIRLHLTIRAGYSFASVRQRVVDALLRAVNSLAPGETLRLAALQRALEKVPGIVVGESTIVDPVADIDPSAGEVLRADAAGILFE